MEVIKVRTENNKERYYVADDEGLPIKPILKFIRFKDSTNHARNTLRMYCQHLKSYFEYLEQRKLDFQEVTIDELELFVDWLQNPYKIPTNKVDSARSPRTINVIINTVLAFYDYIIRDQEYSNNISDRLKMFVSTPSRNFKGSLNGIAQEQKKITRNILKFKVPKSETKNLSKKEMTILINNCNNFRDIFLISLLYETGMRIGEALSLYIEDFDISDMIIELKDRGKLENNARIKATLSARRIDISQNLADMFMEYKAEYHTEEVETNHVFIKISGEHRGRPINYTNIDNLFRTLEKKTGIHVTPHMIRYSSITNLIIAGWQPELVRIRAGYKNNYSTLKTYIHPSDKEIMEAFNKINFNLDINNEKNQ